MVDVLVIGAGPGGSEAAILAAKQGRKVVLVDANKVGGTCLQVGCIPTKTLYHYAATLRQFRQASKLGISAHVEMPALSTLWEHKNHVIETLTNDLLESLRLAHVDVIQGIATILGPNQVDVNGIRYEAEKIVIATGSQPMKPKIPGIDLPGIFDSNTIYQLASLPASMVIIGGGYIGIEWASILHQLGVQVHVIELTDSILPNVDSDISKRLLSLMTKEGIQFHLQHQVSHFSTDGDQNILVHFIDPTVDPLTTHAVFLAMGRQPRLPQIGLEKLGIAYHEKQGIAVNQFYQTSIPSIYAIGDCISGTMLAHRASFQAKELISQWMNQPLTIHWDSLPSTIFTFPEIAFVGSNEKELKQKGIPYRSKRIPLRANGKALIEQETDGFIKLLVDSDLRLLGAHILGLHASDLIAELVLIHQLKMPMTEARNLIHPHPTLSEIVQTAFNSF